MRFKTRKGQAMTEYVIIICLVAVAALLVIGVFGTNIRKLFKSANTSFSKGQAESASIEDKGGDAEVRINSYND